MADRRVSHQEFESSSAETGQGDFWDNVVLGTGPNPDRMHDESSSSKFGHHESSSSESSSNDFSSNAVHDLKCTGWYTSDDGRYKFQSCWKDGNMWIYKRKRTLR